jgi:polysaccharide export outer membrane protein
LAVEVSSISDFTSKDPVRIFNEGGIMYTLTPSNGSQGSGTGSQGSNLKGYLVDPDGYIDYPVIGKLKVSGLTLREIKTLLANRLASDYVKDPVVEVRILNYKVTVMGEVRYPGVVIAPNHRMNVLEAIAASGDINLTGRKDNVMVIREVNGHREFATVNLNSRNAFTNPYFVLKQNDIVYVQAGRAVRENTANIFVRFYLPVVATVISVAAAIVAFSLMNKN